MVIKKVFTHTIGFYQLTETIIKESHILNLYNLSQLVNYCISKELPNILKEKEIKNSDVNNLIDLLQRQMQRDLIILQRKEKMSRAYFLKRFIQRLRTLCKDNLKREDVISILESFYDESKTYKANDFVTKKIKDYIKFAKSNNSLDRLLSYLDVKVVEIQRINYETRKEVLKNE